MTENEIRSKEANPFFTDHFPKSIASKADDGAIPLTDPTIGLTEEDSDELQDLLNKRGAEIADGLYNWDGLLAWKQAESDLQSGDLGRIMKATANIFGDEFDDVKRILGGDVKRIFNAFGWMLSLVNKDGVSGK